MSTYLKQLFSSLAELIDTGMLVSRVVIASETVTYTGYTFKKDASLNDCCWIVKRTVATETDVAEVWAEECRDAVNPYLAVFACSMDNLAGLTWADQTAAILPENQPVIGDATVQSDTEVDVEFTYDFLTHPSMSFRKEYSDDDGDTWQDGGDMADEATTMAAITASFTGLTAETPYMFRIVPFTSAGDGTASDTVEATTDAAP